VENRTPFPRVQAEHNTHYTTSPLFNVCFYAICYFDGRDDTAYGAYNRDVYACIDDRNNVAHSSHRNRDNVVVHIPLRYKRLGT
jgi:hypothetical protein